MLPGSHVRSSRCLVLLVLFLFLASSAFAGYSRVEADEHWTKDVLAGAAIGIVSGWIFTSRYRKEPGRTFLVPAIGRNSAAVALGMTF